MQSCCESCDVKTPWVLCKACKQTKDECANALLNCPGDRIYDKRTGDFACGPCSISDTCDDILVTCTSSNILEGQPGVFECMGHR